MKAERRVNRSELTIDKRPVGGGSQVREHGADKAKCHEHRQDRDERYQPFRAPPQYASAAPRIVAEPVQNKFANEVGGEKTQPGLCCAFAIHGLP
ncbi:hypothetical protein [Rhizobium bangladeshense]|uniref:hypothetical protein n=1 Tax=Rhizobium bangladeshense TaxID=1138189 RepID=UPI0012E78E9D|nr:hypothetical protein [Rhizobium bangladeshense]